LYEEAVNLGFSVSQPAIEQLSYTERVFGDLSTADFQDKLGKRFLRSAFSSGEVPVDLQDPAVGVSAKIDAELPTLGVELLQRSCHPNPPCCTSVALLGLSQGGFGGK
jgi:hypothetical protein